MTFPPCSLYGQAKRQWSHQGCHDNNGLEQQWKEVSVYSVWCLTFTFKSKASLPWGGWVKRNFSCGATGWILTWDFCSQSNNSQQSLYLRSSVQVFMREIWQLTARPVLVSLVPRLSPPHDNNGKYESKEGESLVPFHKWCMARRCHGYNELICHITTRTCWLLAAIDW